MGNQQTGTESKNDENYTPSVFISYSKTDKAFVKNLYDALAAHVSNMWVDWEDIPLSAEWLKEVHKGIEQSDVCICVLSPEGIKSETCHFQLEHAVKCGKRLVPVVCLDVDYREVSKHLNSLNWIFFRTGTDDFNAAMVLLLKALNAEVEHMHAHTRILCRAVQWEESRFDKGLQLKGQDSTDAVQWLYRCAMGTAPYCTPLMLSLIQTSAKLPAYIKGNSRGSIIQNAAGQE